MSNANVVLIRRCRADQGWVRLPDHIAAHRRYATRGTVLSDEMIDHNSLIMFLRFYNVVDAQH